MTNQVITRIVVHSSPFESSRIAEPLPISVRFVKNRASVASCGQVSPRYFSLFLEHFTEAQHFNTCLNRKISVTVDGQIKPCPSLKESYGNTRETSLLRVLEEPRLVQISRITKDQVAVCRDCEFRYICTDCRAFISDAEDPFSKPAKCSYNPYTAKWESGVNNSERTAAAETHV
jgi:SPASM domain peptide maturase of grasp-with-spasm system